MNWYTEEPTKIFFGFNSTPLISAVCPPKLGVVAFAARDPQLVAGSD
jgi:hypothetical protein